MDGTDPFAARSGPDPFATPPLAERMADYVVAAIAEGRLEPGARLMEADIARSLGLSRVPLREAFRVLHGQGIVVITPRRGTRVIRFDRAWTRDVREVRFGIERVAAQGAARRLGHDEGARAALDAAVEAIRAALSRGDLDGANAADLAFHGLLADLTGSPLVRAMWEAIRRHVLILFGIDVREMPDPARILGDHLALRDALLRGDPAGIEAAVREHILWKEDR